MKHRTLLVACSVVTVVTVVACGEIAVDGLKRGEERGDAKQPPVDQIIKEGTAAPEPRPEPPKLPARVLQGDYQDPVSIAANETVILLDAPTFHAPVTVGENSILRGAARFLGGLTISGTRAEQTVWHLDPNVRSEAADATIAWGALTGGGLDLKAVPGKISTVTNTRIDSVELRAVAVPGARLDFAWSAFVGSPVALTLGADAGASSREALIRIVSSEFNLSPVSYPPSVAAFEIFANDFLDPQPDAFYLACTVKNAETDAQHALNLLETNYFKVHPVTQPYRGPKWIFDPFTAGPGRDGADTTWANTHYSNTWVQSDWSYYSVDSAEGSPYGTPGYMLAQSARDTLVDELRHLVYKDETGGVTLGLGLNIGDFQGCTYEARRSRYTCAGDYSFGVKVKVSEPHKDERTLELRPAMATTEASTMLRQVRIAVIELVGRLTDEGTLITAPVVQTPYF